MTTLLSDFATGVIAVAEPETTAFEVAQMMRKHHVGALVVVDAKEKSKPLGMITDRDLVLALIAEGLDPKVFTAGDIMSEQLILASPEMDAMDAAQLMNQYGVRRLVIANDAGLLVGIVTMEDILDLLVRELTAISSGMSGARMREFTERL